MRIRVGADGNPSENSWKLFSGRGREGRLLQWVSWFSMKNENFNIDNCLMDGIYRFGG